MTEKEDEDLVGIPRGLYESVMDALTLVLLLIVGAPVIALLVWAVLWLVTGG